MDTNDLDEQEVQQTLQHLDETVEHLEEELHEMNDPKKKLWMFFWRGVLYGLGLLVAIAIVIPFLLWILKSVEWIPLIGDFLNKIASQMESVRLVK